MKAEPWGESGWLLSNLSVSSSALLRGLRAAGVTAWAGPDSVCVQGLSSETEVLDLASSLTLAETASRLFEIPVLYDGPDLLAVCELVGISVSEVISLHGSMDFEVKSMGFCPGFAYLGPLPPPLDAVPRLGSPRGRVEPGSVALAGGMTAVYPLLKPGGWRLIGRTPLVLVDQASDFFPLEAGDFIRFRKCSETEYKSLVGRCLEPIS